MLFGKDREFNQCYVFKKVLTLHLLKILEISISLKVENF